MEGGLYVDVSISRLHCNECKQKTWHDIVAEHEQSYYDNFWGYTKLLHGQILTCRGCEYLSFRLFDHPFEFQTDGKVEELIYPEREFKRRKRIYIFHTLPEKIQNLYTQTLTAYDNELCLLSAVGLRALIESIVVDKLNPNEFAFSIKSKIDALRKYFSDDVIDTLQDFRFMGNQAAHALDEPSLGDIHRALNVIEGIMGYFYGIEDKVKTYQSVKDGARQ